MMLETSGVQEESGESWVYPGCAHLPRLSWAYLGYARPQHLSWVYRGCAHLQQSLSYPHTSRERNARHSPAALYESVILTSSENIQHAPQAPRSYRSHPICWTVTERPHLSHFLPLLVIRDNQYTLWLTCHGAYRLPLNFTGLHSLQDPHHVVCLRHSVTPNITFTQKVSPLPVSHGPQI